MNVSTSTASKSASSWASASTSGLTQRAHRREVSCPIPPLLAEDAPLTLYRDSPSPHQANDFGELARRGRAKCCRALTRSPSRCHRGELEFSVARTADTVFALEAWFAGDHRCGGSCLSEADCEMQCEAAIAAVRRMTLLDEPANIGGHAGFWRPRHTALPTLRLALGSRGVGPRAQDNEWNRGHDATVTG